MANINYTHGFTFYADDVDGTYPSALILSANRNDLGVNLHMDELEIDLSLEDIRSLIHALQQLTNE